jgi:antibiotic biosynthesis monooxygenase (ABM) superfamily enzyme
MAQRVKAQEAPNVRSQGEQPPAAAPPRYKLALLTWAGAYAVITLILAVLGPAMAPWPLPLRTLLLSGLMVVALTWLVIPSLTRLCRGWLTSGSPGAAGEPMPKQPPTARSST